MSRASALYWGLDRRTDAVEALRAGAEHPGTWPAQAMMLLFDAQDFPGAFETAAVNAAQYWIGFAAQQVPVDPKRKLILEVGNVVGGEYLALAQGRLGIIHLDQARIGVFELRLFGQICCGFREAEDFKALQTFIERNPAWW